MSAGTGQAEGSAPAPQPAQPGAPATSANATVPTANWHHEIVSRIDRWAWIRTLNDQLTAVLGPWRERHQDNPVLELMHGGRWLGHPLHPALSDLPIGLWADLAGALREEGGYGDRRPEVAAAQFRDSAEDRGRQSNRRSLRAQFAKLVEGQGGACARRDALKHFEEAEILGDVIGEEAQHEAIVQRGQLVLVGQFVRSAGRR